MLIFSSTSWTLSSGLIVLMLAGCGYQFRVEGAGPTIGGAHAVVPRESAPTLAVVNFENASFQPGLELKYTSYTRKEFSAGAGVRVVPTPNTADLVLKGSIIAVSVPTIAFSTTATFESRVTVAVKAVVEDARTRKPIWSQTVTASSEFFVTNDLQFNQVLETRALEQAGRLIAEDLATRFMVHLDSGALRASQGTGPPTPESRPETAPKDGESTGP